MTPTYPSGGRDGPGGCFSGDGVPEQLAAMGELDDVAPAAMRELAAMARWIRNLPNASRYFLAGPGSVITLAETDLARFRIIVVVDESPGYSRTNAETRGQRWSSDVDPCDSSAY
jgi:hypothetical protein